MRGSDDWIVDLRRLVDGAVEKVPEADHVVDRRCHELVLQSRIHTRDVAAMEWSHFFAC